MFLSLNSEDILRGSALVRNSTSRGRPRERYDTMTRDPIDTLTHNHGFSMCLLSNAILTSQIMVFYTQAFDFQKKHRNYVRNVLIISKLWVSIISLELLQNCENSFGSQYIFLYIHFYNGNFFITCLNFYLKLNIESMILNNWVIIQTITTRRVTI